MGFFLRAGFTVSEPSEITGLIFPSNGEAGDGNSTRFKFTSPLSWYPATYIWKYYPIQQTGYYTTFFHGGSTSGGSSFTGFGYYGCHPYPQGGSSGTAHNWEISIAGTDIIDDDNANSTVVTKAQWYTQACVARLVNTNELEVKFYWDLDTAATRIITYTTTGDYADAPTSSPHLIFGDAPWSPNNECMSGRFRGLQIYDTNLTLQQIQDRMDLSSNSSVVSNDPGSLWYVNINPTPDDITDKSGNGNDPSWHNSNRPTLYEG